MNGEIFTAPTIRSEIGRAIAITGNYTRKQAEALAAAIKGDKSPTWIHVAHSAEGDFPKSVHSERKNGI